MITTGIIVMLLVAQGIGGAVGWTFGCVMVGAGIGTRLSRRVTNR